MGEGGIDRAIARLVPGMILRSGGDRCHAHRPHMRKSLQPAPPSVDALFHACVTPPPCLNVSRVRSRVRAVLLMRKMKRISSEEKRKYSHDYNSCFSPV